MPLNQQDTCTHFFLMKSLHFILLITRYLAPLPTIEKEFEGTELSTDCKIILTQITSFSDRK